jgi:choline dehydrogenase-like flavoprotein
MKQLEAEVLVIGSGFGGAVVACRLAQAGYSVTILERGRRYPAGDAPNLPQDGAFLPDERRWSWKVDQGLWEVLDLDEIVSVQAAGYGGGSLIYANVHLRPPRSVFNSPWPAVFRNRTELDPYYDLVASMLEVAPVTAHPDFQAEITKSRQFESAAQNLGRRVFYPPLAIRYSDGPNQHGVDQRKCTGCGACCTGCPQSAKNTLDLNYLAIAERHGARVFTQFEALELVERADGTWLVRCFDHLEARRVKVHSAHVFLCAGALHTTELMARARLLDDPQRRPDDERRGNRVRKCVGLGYYPGGDALGIVYETKHPQRPSVGPVISTSMVEWSRDDHGSFFMLQDGGYPERVSRLVGLLRAPAWLHGNRLTRKGNANVPAFLLPPEPQLGRTTLPFATSRAASSLDQILDARKEGAFKAAVPPQLPGVTQRLAKRLSLPLLMSEVVREAVVRSLRHTYRWLCCLSAPVVFVCYLLARWALGPLRFVGVRALRALLRGGGLNRHEIAARVAGVHQKDGERRAVLLAMGRDAAAGYLRYDRKQRRLIANLNLAKLAPGYSKQESLMSDIARQFGGELRGNPAWEFLHKPITVHNQGGCGMADQAPGVVDPNGQVWGCKGLYILDGSVLCTSVGVNPAPTIAAIAERGALAFIRTRYPNYPEGVEMPVEEGAAEYKAQRGRAEIWAAAAQKSGWDLEPPLAPPAAPGDLPAPIGLTFKEELCGYYGEARVVPRDTESYLEHEARGRPQWPLELRLDARVEDLKGFIEDPSHPVMLDGKIEIRLPGDSPGQIGCHRVKGALELFVAVPKDYAFHRDDDRAEMQRDLLREAWQSPEVQAWSVRRGEPAQERRMNYGLEFTDDGGRIWSIKGYKRIASTSSFDAWRQTATLCIELWQGRLGAADSQLRGAGAVHVDICSFLDDTLGSVKATGTEDPNRQAWAVLEFTKFFFGTLQRIYVPALQKVARRSGARRHLEQLE